MVKFSSSRRIAAVLLLVGVALGFGVRGLVSRAHHDDVPGAAAGEDSAGVWTCSMHPQVRMDHPGQCPLCGMDLIPLAPEGAAGDGAAIASDVLVLGDHARLMAQVETAPVERRPLWYELRTVGKVAVDETAVAYITAWVDGRVDRVFADFPGTVVARGDHLVQLYSPDLYATQQEYLASARSGIPQAAEASRQRLRLWGITDEQIEEIARTGAPQTHLTVFATIGGTILEKGVRPGQYVKTGDQLYTIADLSHVWVVLEVYESELAWVQFGQPVEIELEGFPSRRIAGAVGFVEPVLTEATRTVRVRVMVRNEEGLLKPGMFVQARVRTPIDADGGPGSTGLEGEWVCPMHPMVIQDGPGTCPFCGMQLDQVPGTPAPHAPILAVPAEAVLTTGRRQLAFVEDVPARYRLVEPTLGPRAGDFFPVLSGLAEGARVVVRGNFLLDSQLQLTGRPSLLHPEGLTGGGGAHDHGGGAATGGSSTPVDDGRGGHQDHQGAAPPPPPAPSPAADHEGPAPPPATPGPGAPTGHEGHGAPPTAPPPPAPAGGRGDHGSHGGH